jgi:hypothetical protein
VILDERTQLPELLLLITESERHPRFYTYRDQVSPATSDSRIRHALRDLVAAGKLVRKGPARDRYWNVVPS